VEALDNLDVANPVIDDADGTILHRCLDTSAEVVTTNYNMAYFEVVDGVVKTA